MGGMALFGTLGPWALSELLKATTLLLVVFAAAAALRHASAGVRHLVWSAAIVAVLGLPLLSVVVPWRLPVLPARSAVRAIDAGLAPPATPASGRDREPAAAPAGDRSAAGAAGAAATAPLTSASVPPSSGGPRWPSGAELVWALLALWAVGVGLVLVRLAVGALRVRRIVARAQPLTTPDWTRPLFEAADRLDLARAPRLLQSDRMPMPFASGMLRPAIVLPTSAAQWSDRRRRAVLLHELAHVRRFDLLINVLGRVTCALYWFHPLVWMAARRMRAESERAADDTVLSVGTRASEYADHLLQIVCAAGRSSTPAVALPMAQRKEFEGRMLAILEANSRRGSPSRRYTLALAALACALVLPMAALAPAATTGQAQADAGSAAPGRAPDQPGPWAGMPDRSSLRMEITQAPSRAPRRADQPPDLPAPQAPSAVPSPQEPAQQDTGSSRVVEALVRALEDPAVEVRENAVYALGKREAPAAVPAVVRRLRQDQAPKVREMAAWALGQIESRAAAPALGEAARTDSDVSVRATSVWALGQIEDPASVSALAAVLADRVEEIRARAAWALGSIEPRTAPPELLRALRDASPAVRMRAAWATGRIEDRAAVGPLAPLLEDSAADVRKAALWALSHIDSEDARAVLIRVLDSKDPQVRARAVRALAGQSSDPWPWPWPDPRIR